MRQYEAQLELTRRDVSAELSMRVEREGRGRLRERGGGRGMMGFSRESHFTAVGPLAKLQLYQVNHHHGAVPTVNSTLLSVGNLAKAAAVV